MTIPQDENEKFERVGSYMDLYELGRQLDICKSKIFLGNNAAFLGPLLSMMNFVWTEELPTASVDGVTFCWNPVWFSSLSPATRVTVLYHELWHVARMHIVRRGDRDPKVWNYACDIRINNDLATLGHSFHGTDPWLDHSYDAGGIAVEEDIYDALMNQGKDWLEELLESIGGKDAWGHEAVVLSGSGDMAEDASTDAKNEQTNAVVQATHQAKIAGAAGDIPGHVESLLKQFLTPVVPWENLLHKFFHDLLDEDYSWARPNRRIQHVYLPSRFEDEGKLDHLIYYLDVSGSVTDSQVVRFNSEVKFIKERFNPKKLTLVQFDTRITDEKTMLETEEFNELIVVGRGGTDLAPVREHIIENKPTAVVIFSDLFCPPMEKLPVDVPTIWVAIGNKEASVKFGQLIHIKG